MDFLKAETDSWFLRDQHHGVEFVAERHLQVSWYFQYGGYECMELFCSLLRYTLEEGQIYQCVYELRRRKDQTGA